VFWLAALLRDGMVAWWHGWLVTDNSRQTAAIAIAQQPAASSHARRQPAPRRPGFSKTCGGPQSEEGAAAHALLALAGLRSMQQLCVP
jgi:hypothetical protein